MAGQGVLYYTHGRSGNCTSAHANASIACIISRLELRKPDDFFSLSNTHHPMLVHSKTQD